MGVDRQVGCGLDGLHQVECGVGGEQACHVLDGDGVHAHLGQSLRHGDEIGDVVHRAHGVGNRTLGMLAGHFHRFDGDPHVTSVVHGVEHAEHVDAVVGRLAHEGAHHIVGVVAVAQQILAAQQHVDPGVGQRPAQFLQAFPRVFLEEAHAGVKSGAAPGFQGPEARAVEFAADRQHVLGAHARGDERLVAVAQDEVGDVYFSHDISVTCLGGRRWPPRWRPRSVPEGGVPRSSIAPGALPRSWY